MLFGEKHRTRQTIWGNKISFLILSFDIDNEQTCAKCSSPFPVCTQKAHSGMIAEMGLFYRLTCLPYQRPVFSITCFYYFCFSSKWSIMLTKCPISGLLSCSSAPICLPLIRISSVIKEEKITTGICWKNLSSFISFVR